MLPKWSNNDFIVNQSREILPSPQKGRDKEEQWQDKLSVEGCTGLEFTHSRNIR